DVIIINTCGFIQDAKEESIETIIRAGQLKESANCRAVIVTGCLTQRYKEKIMKEMPEVDAVLGTGTFGSIVDTIKNVLQGRKINNIGKPSFDYKASIPRIVTDSHFAYVKIAEGCNNNCTYCSIPAIRGPLYSREIDDIYEEVKQLTAAGVQEIILVAQDTTQYGVDIYNKPAITELLKKLLTIKDIGWIRLLYSYPEYVTDELIDVIAENDKICNYLDLPVQHSSNKIRKAMNRRGSRNQLMKLMKTLRKKIPDIALRTSLIVGFPGENKEDFNTLVDFVREVKFDRLGVFKYSREEETTAANFDNQVSDKIKQKRFEKIMEIQRQISYNNNSYFLNKKLQVLVDEVNKENAFARSQYDAPDVDNQIILPADNLKRGDMIMCYIKEAYEYDLLGEIVS
ncbi:MAG: 30S ribosomal protein S12 methylthiotransferase RimO, partial [Halanaerobiales bacterium]